MDLKNVSIAGLVGMLSAVVLLALMDVNLIGWLGVWLTPGAAWIVGLLFTIVLAFAFASLWGVALKQDAIKKMPRPVGGLVYGAIVGLLFVFVIPLILSVLAGDPTVGVSSGTGFDALPEAFGAHLVPALPDLGFDPPLRSLAAEDWWQRDDYVGRLLPFGLAFMVFGLVLGLMAKDGK